MLLSSRLDAAELAELLARLHADLSQRMHAAGRELVDATDHPTEATPPENPHKGTSSGNEVKAGIGSGKPNLLLGALSILAGLPHGC